MLTRVEFIDESGKIVFSGEVVPKHIEVFLKECIDKHFSKDKIIKQINTEFIQTEIRIKIKNSRKD